MYVTPGSSSRSHALEQSLITQNNHSVLSNLLQGVDKVLMLAAGGGGDIAGMLPTCFEIQRLPNSTGSGPIEVVLAGLTCKRQAHDPIAATHGCRDIASIANIDRHGPHGRIGTVAHDTHFVTEDGRTMQHIEALMLAQQPHFPLNKMPHVLMVDYTAGIDPVYQDLEFFCQQHGIGALLVADVGGDIIAYGTEPTLESPLCDQMSLKIASDWRGRSFCCVSGLGADGEIMLGEAYQRMAGIASENGFYGMLELNQNDLDRYRKILDGVPTECSKQLIRYIDACNGQEPLKSSRFSKLLDSLNSFANQPPISYSFAFPDHDHLFPEHEVQRYGIRNGTRTVELSLLTLGTLIFDPRAVWKSNLFAQESLITSNDNFLEVERKVRSRGICTELTHPE